MESTGFHKTGLAGLEPTTYGLGNRRSIRLSYSPSQAIMGVESRRGDRNGWVLPSGCSHRLRKVRAPRWPGLLGNAQCG
ncbi:hypothetical protein Syn8016DRAFT_1647 [Synechococcus sp. WH 8016]|nr:hypothetical protein Syn8016DRAFT_1647 [Synechococcus sp. WH 8016]